MSKKANMSETWGGVMIGEAKGVESVPDGALITEAGVARRCIRCEHYECPCCQDFCDSCLFSEEEPGCARREDEFFVFKKWEGEEEEHRIHKICDEQSQCAYDRERHPDIDVIFELKSKWHHGGRFGVTEDGRVWFAGPEEDDEEESA